MARTGRQASSSDMVRSLAVILLPLLVITVLFTRNPDPPVAVVDVAPVLEVARRQAPYPVLAPANLPPDWRPTRVAWEKLGQPVLNGEPAVRNGWRLGYLDPGNTYVALEQGDLRAEDMVADATRKGVPDGESAVAGTTWQRRVSADGRTRSLVLPSTPVTTVVAGDTDYAELEAFAATLRSG